jgi:mRNA interferase RelE/StbE
MLEKNCLAMYQKNSFENYKLDFTNAAKKELKKMDSSVAEQIHNVLKELVKGAPNIDVIKMQGSDSTYRVRSGNFRIIFEDHKHIITVLVIHIGPRKDAYRKF